ncbi:MAG: tagaturonate epimerase family protein [Ignavibacteria bacterium]
MESYSKDTFERVMNDSENRIEKMDFGGCEISIYVKSVTFSGNEIFFIGRNELKKSLYITYTESDVKYAPNFEGEGISKLDDNCLLKKCDLTTGNRIELQKIFSFLNPVLVGDKNSFGFGDRIGLANQGHIQSLEDTDFIPILAQQSIRELERTNRTADEVMDAAVWSVFQEGYKKGFGSDADHLKKFEDIDLMMKAGFTMFTIDPSDHVDNNADTYKHAELSEKNKSINWKVLNEDMGNAVKKYLSPIKVADNLTLSPTEEDIFRAYAKYGNAIIHIKEMSDYLDNNYSNKPHELEISVDETDSVTSPFEHYFIVNELTRLNVKFISIAPRFIGDFEKGIDYKGSLSIFEKEYLKHISIVRYFGNYKISLHSGSDKFSVYNIIGKINNSRTHVKTAGTSYLEALRVIAVKSPSLFREILSVSSDLYENEKKTYHVSANLNNIKEEAEYSDTELPELLSDNDCRQVLHVAFGKILNSNGQNGIPAFKDRILEVLIQNEDTYDEYLISHFRKHLTPFKSN